MRCVDFVQFLLASWALGGAHHVTQSFTICQLSLQHVAEKRRVWTALRLHCLWSMASGLRLESLRSARARHRPDREHGQRAALHPSKNYTNNTIEAVPYHLL